MLEQLREAISRFELLEGVNDPSILKALFFAGGMGSGKGFVASLMTGDPALEKNPVLHQLASSLGLGVKYVGSDVFLERLMRREGLSLKRDLETPRVQLHLRDEARRLANARRSYYLEGRLGLIIETTGQNLKAIHHAKDLKELGYDVGMVYVDVPLEVAQKANEKRERSASPELVEKTWRRSQENKGQFKRFFDFFIEVENEERLDLDSPIYKAKIRPELQKIAHKFFSTPVKNPIGKRWIASQLPPGARRPRSREQVPEKHAPAKGTILRLTKRGVMRR